MLYLIKGSRVREYRRQNVDILSAPEHTSFEVAYSHRWIQTGVRPQPNDGAVIVFADSPYARFEPIRFAVIEDVSETDGRVMLRGRLGPFVCTLDRDALSDHWGAIPEDDPERPGRHRFLIEDENVGLFTPNSTAAYDEAWRSAIDQLDSNDFFDETTIARLVRSTVGDRELEAGSPVTVGEEVTLDIELRTPYPVDETFTPTLICEPDGAAELVNAEPFAATGSATLTLRLLEPGPAELTVGIAGRSLTSTRLHLQLEGRGERARSARPSETSGGLVDVTAVARLLMRQATLGDEAWLDLLDDHLLRARPEDPVLLNLVAEHASELDRHERAMRALDQIDGRTPSQQSRMLNAAVRCGANDRVEALLEETDLSNSDDFDEFLRAVKAAPEATVNLVLRAEFSGRHLGDESRCRLVVAAWPQLNSVDLMCEAADWVAYVDPAQGARLLFDQWKNPVQMPDRAMDLLLDWQVEKSLLGPYLRERLHRAIAAEDVKAVERSLENLGCIATAQQPELILKAGTALLAQRDTFTFERGLELCEHGVYEALRHDNIDLAIDAVATLRTTTATRSKDVTERVAGLAAAIDEAIESSEALARWERMRSETRADALCQSTRGKRLFALGGKPFDGFDDLAESLGLADHRWIETDKDKGPNHDWADGLRDGDLVIAVLPFIGHSNTIVKDKAVRKGARFEIVHHNVMSMLDGIARAVKPVEA